MGDTHCLIQHSFEVGFAGQCNGVKVWSEFEKEVINYVDKLFAKVDPCHHEYLNQAIITLSEHIHKQYFYKLPLWPCVGGKNVKSVELNITESYRSGCMHVFWCCVGEITVTDTRPFDKTFETNFTGSPNMKVDIRPVNGLRAQISGGNHLT